MPRRSSLPQPRKLAQQNRKRAGKSGKARQEFRRQNRQGRPPAGLRTSGERGRVEIERGRKHQQQHADAQLEHLGIGLGNHQRPERHARNSADQKWRRQTEIDRPPDRGHRGSLRDDRTDQHQRHRERRWQRTSARLPAPSAPMPSRRGRRRSRRQRRRRTEAQALPWSWAFAISWITPARIDGEPEYRGGFALARSNGVGQVCEDLFVRYSVTIAIANEASWEQPSRLPRRMVGRIGMEEDASADERGRPSTGHADLHWPWRAGSSRRQVDGLKTHSRTCSTSSSTRTCARSY